MANVKTTQQLLTYFSLDQSGGAADRQTLSSVGPPCQISTLFKTFIFKPAFYKCPCFDTFKKGKSTERAMKVWREFTVFAVGGSNRMQHHTTQDKNRVSRTRWHFYSIVNYLVDPFPCDAAASALPIHSHSKYIQHRYLQSAGAPQLVIILLTNPHQISHNANPLGMMVHGSYSSVNTSNCAPACIIKL